MDAINLTEILENEYLHSAVVLTRISQMIV